MSKAAFRTGSHVVFSIRLHICFVTLYRRKVFTQPMLDRMPDILSRVLDPNNCILEQFNGEPDHVHLLVDLHPDTNISRLVGSMKSASSRILRKEFSERIDSFYWGPKAKLWHGSKCVVSCGGAPLDIVKQYIENQAGGIAPKED
ncbi:MAG: IS200/IS605 family transposase [Phormidesmis sp.]